MTDFVLYGVCESGNCYKVALMLDLCGLSWSAGPIDWFNGEERKQFSNSKNELAEMPAFEHGQVLLSQSGVILTYLSELTGKFAGRNASDQREVLRWMFFDNHKFTTFYQLTREIVGLKQSAETPVTEFLRGKAIAALEKVERRLGDRPFVVGDYPTIADISMLGFQYYDERTGIDMTAYRNIAGWKQRIAALAGWRAPYDNQLPRCLDWSNGRYPVWPAH